MPSCSTKNCKMMLNEEILGWVLGTGVILLESSRVSPVESVQSSQAEIYLRHSERKSPRNRRANLAEVNERCSSALLQWFGAALMSLICVVGGAGDGAAHQRVIFTRKYSPQLWIRDKPNLSCTSEGSQRRSTGPI